MSRRFETNISELLSRLKTWKTCAQALASTHPESTPHSADLQEQLKVTRLA